MDFIIPLLYFICFNGELVILLKKSFSKCLPLTFMLTAFSLFFSQIVFKTFSIGIVANILFALSFLFTLGIKVIKKSSLEEVKELFLCNGLYIFILLYIGLFIFDFKREFSMWDEFSHWGVMVKEMFRLDQFYSINLSTLMVHKDYPPILQLYELFYLKIAGGYNEIYLIRALHLFEFSLLIPFISKDEDKSKLRILKAIMFIVITYLLILLFDCHGVINTIYTDYFMVLLTAYLLGIIITEKNITSNFNLFIMFVGLSFLLLTKQMGLPLYLMIIYFFVSSIIFNRINTKHPVRKIILVLLTLIMPLTFYTGWNNYVDNLGVVRQFDLKNIDYNKLEDYQIETYENFMSATTKESIISSPLKVSYLVFTVSIFIFLCLLCYWFRNIYSPGKIINLNVTLTFGAIGYALVMLFLYVFAFGKVEGPTLSSFNRYMPTFILISLITIFILINCIIDKFDTKKYFIVFGIVLVFLLIIQNKENYLKLIPALRTSEKTLYEKCSHDLLTNEVFGKKIFIVAQDSEGDFQFRIKYYVGNIETNLNNYDWENNKKYYETIKEYVSNYDYLYLAQINDEFENTFGQYFDKVKLYGLYEINNEKFELIK